MDTTKTITHVSLCAGYGGIDLGLKRAIPGLRTIAFSEIEAYACANLVAKMEAGLLDAAPIWTDVKTFPWELFRDRVDLLSGGYPCQPFSCAGKRLGSEDQRHLWPFMSAGITAMRPKLCFFENVEGHITMGLPNVLEDLAGMGYRSTWGIFSAEECGAPHRRKRVFIMADSGSQGLEGYDQRDSSTITSIPIRADSRSGSQHDRWPARPMEEQYAWEPPRVLGNSDCWGQSLSINGRSCSEENCGGESDVEQAESRNLKSGMGGISHGDTARVDRLRLLGNGVVPATAELAFKTLYKELNP